MFKLFNIEHSANILLESIKQFTAALLQTAGLHNQTQLPQMGESGGEVIGAASQLISAMLQTIGLHSQDAVLDNFMPVLENLGAIAFIVAVLGGLASFALFGNYKKALYLVIGPTLFYWVLTTRVPATHVDICTSNACNPNSQSQLESFIQTYTNIAPQSTAQVSWFFAKWDSIVSNVVQNFSQVVVDGQNKEHLIAAARERVAPDLLVARAIDKPFVKLTSLGMAGHCAELTNIDQQRGRLKAQIDKKQKSVNRLNGSEDSSQAEKDALTDEIGILQLRLSDLDAQYNDALIGVTVENIDFPEDMQEFVTGLTPPFTAKEQVSCQDVWDYTYRAFENEADKLLTLTAEQQADQTIPWDKVRLGIIEMLQGPLQTPGGPATQQELQNAKDRLAAVILKNTLASQAHHAMTDQIHSRTPWEQKTFTATFSNVANHEARGAKMTLIHFAGSIPYIQGLLLYLLAMMFPFFALFLILPGRYSAFLVWMSLWAWVKSWDFGFAFIDFIRDILWQFINPSLNSAENQALNWNDLSSVFALINTHDPLASLNTYYTVVGILTIAIPAFTAHLCLGATNLFDAFKGTMGQQSQEFGRRTTKRSKNFEWSEVENQMARRKSEEAMKAAKAAGYNPQQMEDGTWRASTTDAAKNRHMDAEMKMARYKQHFSAENMELRQYAAMLSRRKMGYSNGASLDYISAKANGVTEKYMGRSIAGDQNAPWGSTKGSSSDHTAGFIRQGAGSTLPIAGVDGD